MSAWTREWPTEAGWYWVRHVSVYAKNEAPRLEPCQVRVGGGKPFYVIGGAFLFKGETVTAEFQPMTMPEDV